MCSKQKSATLFAAFIAHLVLLASLSARGAGVTIITHGFNSNTSDWIEPMAKEIAYYDHLPGNSSTCYRVYFDFEAPTGRYRLTSKRIFGLLPNTTDSGEIIVKIDWSPFDGDLSDLFLFTGDIKSTVEVANPIVGAILNSNFIQELNGHSLAELPIHLVGHSRGGSLVCEIARLLGVQGVWTDHLTTLDPHPLDDLFLPVDAPANIYENVFFADNYWEDSNLISGHKVIGAYNRKLLDLTGGYGSAHSDTHLWYHGTVVPSIPTSDNEASLTSHERLTWWSGYELNGLRAGFFYSLIGGGNRFSADEPSGFNTGKINNGVNRHWDFGLGTMANRALLPERKVNWPNIILFNLTGTNYFMQPSASGLMDQKVIKVDQSDTVPAQLYFQYGGATDGSATLRVFLDADANPYDANQTDIHTRQLAATGTTRVGKTGFSAQLDARTVAVGRYFVGAEISAGGYRRFLYAPERLLVCPQLSVSIASLAPLQLRVVGLHNLKVALEQTRDFKSWTRLPWQTLTATDSAALTGETVFSDPNTTGDAARFFRAVYLP